MLAELSKSHSSYTYAFFGYGPEMESMPEKQQSMPLEDTTNTSAELNSSCKLYESYELIEEKKFENDPQGLILESGV